MYTPLSTQLSFRLMVLKPGSGSETVSVQLSAYEIDSAPTYDAISYVWGDASSTLPIICDGNVVDVTISLHWALTRVRLPDRPRTLWADALCINQNDDHERNQQVTMMGSIYSKAQHVFACMGDDPHNEARHIKSLLKDYYGVSDGNPPMGLAHLGGKPPTREDSRWKYLTRLLARSWFSRVWVLQEVGLAKDPRVLYGDSEFGFRALMAAVGSAASWINTYPKAHRYGVSALLIHTIWSDWNREQEDGSASSKYYYTLLDILDHASMLSCSDPRDYIYAFLGHPVCKAAAIDGYVIVPDYKKDKLVVYREVGEMLFRALGLRTLASVEHNVTTIDEDYPTWVVRWDVQAVVNNLYRYPKWGPSASGDRVPYLPPYLRGDRLNVEGIMVDKVAQVFKISSVPENLELRFTERGTKTVLSLDGLIRVLQQETSYGPESLRRLSTTLCAECFTGVATSEVHHAFTSYLAFHRSSSLRQQLSKKIARYSDFHLVVKYWQLIYTICYGRAFIVTEKGHYGLGPSIAKPGDSAWVLLGGEVPFILRKRNIDNSDEGELRLVGPCYLHGFMKGEAPAGWLAGTFTKKDIRIY